MICEMCRPTKAISAWECTTNISIKQNKTEQNPSLIVQISYIMLIN